VCCPVGEEIKVVTEIKMEGLIFSQQSWWRFKCCGVWHSFLGVTLPR